MAVTKAAITAITARSEIIHLNELIGNRLKDLRIRRALTQEELAAKAGMGKNTVNRIERNLNEPHMSTLRKLAQALGVEPHELLEGEDHV